MTPVNHKKVRVSNLPTTVAVLEEQARVLCVSKAAKSVPVSSRKPPHEDQVPDPTQWAMTVGKRSVCVFYFIDLIRLCPPSRQVS